jgi:hypothetical protein
MASHFKFYFYYMNSPKHTLVLGASDNPARYSYLAVNRLRNAGHPVKAIGTKHTLIADVPVETEKKQSSRLIRTESSSTPGQRIWNWKNLRKTKELPP